MGRAQNAQERANRPADVVGQRNAPFGHHAPVDSASTLEPASGHEKLAAHRLPFQQSATVSSGSSLMLGPLLQPAQEAMPPRVASAGEILFQGVILRVPGS